jgi:hypothetical protein
MGWSEHRGTVSQAFSEWQMIDRDQRAFLSFGLRIAHETYDRLWDEAEREPGDPDGPELVDVFDDRIDGLWPHDYEWMYLAAVVRDAVTSFEVYLEKASEEILAAHGAAFKKPPWWRDLKDLFDLLGVQIETVAVRRIRDLRHFLTHQRGELRTEAQRQKFAPHPEDFAPIVVELTEASAVEILDQLGDVVRIINPAVWERTFGGRRVVQLQADPST